MVRLDGGVVTVFMRRGAGMQIFMAVTGGRMAVLVAVAVFVRMAVTVLMGMHQIAVAVLVVVHMGMGMGVPVLMRMAVWRRVIVIMRI